MTKLNISIKILLPIILLFFLPTFNLVKNNLNYPFFSLLFRGNAIAENSQNSGQQTNLQTYDEENIPLKTRYPNNMVVFDSGSSEGIGISFNFKPQNNDLDNTEISFFFPIGSNSVSDFEQFVMGKNGLMSNNGWNLASEKTQDNQFPYTWIKKVINFNSNSGESGIILLGESNNQAIQIILIPPATNTQIYWQSVKTILDNAQFKSQLLPLKSQQSDNVKVIYHCLKGNSVEGENLSIIYQKDTNSITITRSNQENDIINLPNVVSASGAKYSDNKITFWEKNGNGFLEVNNQIVLRDCRVTD